MDKNAEDSRFVWIDCEMTGLDIHHDELCEIAVVPTDGNLNILDSGIDLPITPSQTAQDHMSDFVRNMHTKSGLIERWKHGMTVEQAQERVFQYLQDFISNDKTAILAGNSIGSDKKFLDTFMPKITGMLHYRVIDVSTLKELCRRWYPTDFQCKPQKHGGHRALWDIIESIDELKYYRQAIFIPQDGTVERCQQIADSVEQESLLRSYEQGTVEVRES